MKRGEAIKTLEYYIQTIDDSDLTMTAREWDEFDERMRDAIDMAIEALKAKCPTCKRCSDHQESGTRCPIEEHYALPKDGFCHLYEPYKAESEEEE